MVQFTENLIYAKQQQPSIEEDLLVHKKEGGIEYLSALMLFSLVGLLFLYAVTSKQLSITQNRLRDALDISCLGALIVNEESYEESKAIKIDNNPARLKEIFTNLLITNLELDDSLFPYNDEMFGKITIHSFILYQLDGEEFYEFRVNEDGSVNVQSHKYEGTETTPDGSNIVSATLYADIGMTISTCFKINKYVHVERSVDVVDY